MWVTNAVALFLIPPVWIGLGLLAAYYIDYVVGVLIWIVGLVGMLLLLIWGPIYELADTRLGRWIKRKWHRT